MISEDNKARILNKFKVKLLALVEQLVKNLLKRNFPYASFSGVISRQLFFRVSVSSSSERLYSKCLLSNSRKEKIIPCVLQAGFSEKKIAFFKINVNVWDCISSVTLWIYENKTPWWKFSEKRFDYFRDLYLFSEPGNCLSVIGEILWLLKTLVECHRCLVYKDLTNFTWKNRDEVLC